MANDKHNDIQQGLVKLAKEMIVNMKQMTITLPCESYETLAKQANLKYPKKDYRTLKRSLTYYGFIEKKCGKKES